MGCVKCVQILYEIQQSGVVLLGQEIGIAG
jgi:hypothetical protein